MWVLSCAQAKAKREKEAVALRGEPPPPNRAFRLPMRLVPDLVMVWQLLQVLPPQLRPASPAGHPLFYSTCFYQALVDLGRCSDHDPSQITASGLAVPFVSPMKLLINDAACCTFQLHAHNTVVCMLTILRRRRSRQAAEMQLGVCRCLRL